MNASLLGPWVDPEIQEDEPWRSLEGIVKFIEFPIRVQAMSHRAFHLYWQRHHSPHAMHLLGFSQFIRKYNSAHVFPTPTSGLPVHYRQDVPFEGASEVWINDWREIGDWLKHPLYAELLQADEWRFIAQDGRGKVIVTKEEKLYEPLRDSHENGKVKLYLQVKAQAGLERDQFHRAVSDHGKAIVERPELRDLLFKLAISHRLADPNPIDFIPPCGVDAIVELWFDSRNALAHFFAHPDYASMIRPNERGFADADSWHAIVAKMHVVHDEFSFQPSVTQPIPFDWRE
jgi:hypothetical protein